VWRAGFGGDVEVLLEGETGGERSWAVRRRVSELGLPGPLERGSVSYLGWTALP
jgi:hypothetical protein